MQLSKGNIVLLILLALGGAFIWFYERELPTTDEVKASEGMLFAARTPDQVKVIVFTAGDTRWALFRTGTPSAPAPSPGLGMPPAADDANAGWRLGEPLEDEADPVAVDRFLSALLTAKSASRLTLQDSDSPDSFGLGSPQATVRLRFRDDREAEILIGGRAPFGAGVYVMVKGERDIRLLELGPEVLGLTAGALRRRELLGAQAYMIDHLTINDQLEFRRRGSAWAMIRPAALAVKRNRIDNLMSALASAGIEDFTASGPAPTVTVVFANGDTPVTVLRFAPPAPGAEYAYATLSTRPGWFTVKAALLAPLAGAAVDFAEKSFAPLGVYDIAAVAISGSGRNDKIERTASGDWPGEFENALKALLALPLQNYELLPAAQAPQPVAQADYTITFTRFEEDPYVVYAWRAGNDFTVWRAGEPARARLATGVLLPTINSLKP